MESCGKRPRVLLHRFIFGIDIDKSKCEESRGDIHISPRVPR